MTTQAQIQFTETSTNTGKDNLLRTALRANGTFSLISGSAFLLASAQIADFLGIKDSDILGFLNGTSFMLVLGAGLLFFAGGLLWTASRPKLNKMMAREIVFMDIMWVIASAVLLLTEALPLTTEGSWAILIVADIVATFAVLQYVGIRRLSK